jgi:hypothetical protein
MELLDRKPDGERQGESQSGSGAGGRPSNDMDGEIPFAPEMRI